MAYSYWNSFEETYKHKLKNAYTLNALCNTDS